jgi:hypothetical protein
MYAPLVIGGVCTRSHHYTCGRVAYGHSHSAHISYDDTYQYLCTNEVGHTYTRADFGAYADCHVSTHAHSTPYRDDTLNTLAHSTPYHDDTPNTLAHSTPYHDDTPNTLAHSTPHPNDDLDICPNANVYSHTKLHTGRSPRHRLLPRQRDRG